jgi:hypothetical protein
VAVFLGLLFYEEVPWGRLVLDLVSR